MFAGIEVLTIVTFTSQLENLVKFTESYKSIEVETLSDDIQLKKVQKKTLSHNFTV